MESKGSSSQYIIVIVWSFLLVGKASMESTGEDITVMTIEAKEIKLILNTRRTGGSGSIKDDQFYERQEHPHFQKPSTSLMENQKYQLDSYSGLTHSLVLPLLCQLVSNVMPLDLADIPSETNSGALRFFRNKHFKGISQIVRIQSGTCVNLPYDLVAKVGSIDTLGLCVLLWELGDCNGKHRMIRGDEDENPSSSRVATDAAFRSLELC